MAKVHHAALRLLSTLIFSVLIVGVSSGAIAAPAAVEAVADLLSKEASDRSDEIYRVEAEFERIQFGDGDTFRYRFKESDGIEGRDGKPYNGSIRLLGYDTPERMAVGIGMYYNQTCGPAASAFFKKAMKEAQKIVILARPDRRTKGRILGHVLYTDRSGRTQTIAEAMIRQGLAYETVSVFGDNGFPELRADILRAWQESPLNAAIERGQTPAFMSPYIWRKVNLQFSNRMTRWNFMSAEERDEWMREEYPSEHRQALDRADEIRASLLAKARRSPNNRLSKEVLFFLEKLPRSQDERDCPL